MEMMAVYVSTQQRLARRLEGGARRSSANTSVARWPQLRLSSWRKVAARVVGVQQVRSMRTFSVVTP